MRRMLFVVLPRQTRYTLVQYQRTLRRRSLGRGSKQKSQATMPSNSLEIRAVTTLLHETLFRADAKFAYLLNAGELGLIETLKELSAERASQTSAPGRKSIASHANHVLYGIELANRSLGGEQGVYESADWDQAWKLETVSDRQWQELVSRLEQQSRLLIDKVREPREWNEVILTGVFSIPAHTAYHLGAIRQMLRCDGDLRGVG